MQYYLLELFALYIKTLGHSKCKTIKQWKGQWKSNNFLTQTLTILHCLITFGY